MITPRTFRLGTLVAPALLVALVTSGAHRGHVLHVVGVVLTLLWLVLAGALFVQFVFALRDNVRSRDAASPWDRIDVLTAGGAAMLWTGTGALAASALTGWASLSVVGVLGVGTVYIAAVWCAIVAAGKRPWRDAVVTREVLPALATEGDTLREEIRLVDVAIPPGMRLFVLGRAHRHGALSRYVVDNKDAGGEVLLESELGPAPRGEHRAPPLALWLGDVLGLARTAVVHRGPCEFTVVPKQLAVDGAKVLLGAGGDDANSIQTKHMPTEGTFRIRDYAPGDDARRIHWVRSVQRDQLVVRLPDEIPPAEPAVRLILDNELFGTDTLTCRAPDDILDVLVRVWLGVGKALVDQGTRVTLVAAVDKAGTIAAVERALIPRTTSVAARFGARIEWQASLPLCAIVADRREKQIVISSRPRRVPLVTQVGWVVVPEVAWGSHEPELPPEHAAKHDFPLGSPDNRRGRRARERVKAMMRWHDRALFSQVMCWIDWTRFSGDHVARPHGNRVELEVIP
jgi:uncharacterized protein (DUF58 family)